MSNKKQSSIDWLEEQIKDISYVAEASEMSKKFKSVYEQAKAMHKEEVINSILDNRNITSQVTFKDAEQYYNETFGGEDE